jgi:hypothetical protein
VQLTKAGDLNYPQGTPTGNAPPEGTRSGGEVGRRGVLAHRRRTVTSLWAFAVSFAVVLAGSCAVTLAAPVGPELPTGSDLPDPSTMRLSDGDQGGAIGVAPGLEEAMRDERRKADRIERRLEDPAFEQRIEGSATEFGSVGDEAAIDVLLAEEGHLIQPAPETLSEGPAEVERFFGESSALVEMPGETHPVVAISSAPLRDANESGEVAEVDLTVEHTPEGPEVVNPLVPTEIPSDAAAPLSVGTVDVALEGAAQSDASVVRETPVYPNALEDTDYVIKPTTYGAETFLQLRSEASPEDFVFDLDLPAGASLVEGDSAGRETANAAESTTSAGDPLLMVNEPLAWDAVGQPVELELEVDGGELRLVVAHRGAGLAYPLMVDPWYNAPTQSSFHGWTPEQTYPAHGYGWGASWLPLYNESSQGLPYLQMRGDAQFYFPPWVGLYYNGDYAAWKLKAPGPEARFTHFEASVWHYPNSSILVAGIVEPGVAWQSQNLYYDWEFGRQVSQSASSPTWNNWIYVYLTANGTAWRSPIAGNTVFQATLGNAKAFVEDVTPPTVELQSHTNLPTGWTDNATISTNLRAWDNGIGLKGFRLWVPNDDPVKTTKVLDKAVPCDGITTTATTTACPRDNHMIYSDHVPGSFTYKAEEMPQGINTVTGKAYDLAGSTSADITWNVKVDDTAPEVDPLAGSLVEADGEMLLADDYTLNVRGSDGTPGSAATERSGVKSVQVMVDGTPMPGGYFENNCSTAGCPASVDRTFTFDPDSFAPGEYTIAATVKDQLGHPKETDSVTVVVPNEVERIAAQASPDSVAPSEIVDFEDGTSGRASVDPPTGGSDSFTSSDTAAPGSRIEVSEEDGYALPTDEGELTVAPTAGVTAPNGIEGGSGDVVVFAEARGATTHTITRPRPDGVETSLILESAASPSAYSWDLALPADEHLRENLASGSIEVVASNPDPDLETAVAEFHPPVALDATGARIPATLSISGDTLTMTLDRSDATYPLVASSWISSLDTFVESSGGGDVRRSERKAFKGRGFYFGYNDSFDSTRLAEADAGGSQILRVTGLGAWCHVQDEPPAGGNPTDDPNDPSYDWSTFDGPLSEIDQIEHPNNELGVVVVLSSAPGWADDLERTSTGCENNTPPPDVSGSGLNYWRNYIRAFIKRYRSRAQGGLGYLKHVIAFEVWNEPNLRKFWGDTDPSAEDYADVYDAAHEAINAVAPARRIPILTAGLSPSAGDPDAEGENPASPVSFLTDVLNEIDSNHTPDGASVHAYASAKSQPGPVAAGILNDYDNIGEVLHDTGNDGVDRWVTEVGYPSRYKDESGNEFEDIENQSEVLTRILKEFRALRRRTDSAAKPERPRSLIIHRLVDAYDHELKPNIVQGDGETRLFGVLRFDDRGPSEPPQFPRKTGPAPNSVQPFCALAKLVRKANDCPPASP